MDRRIFHLKSLILSDLKHPWTVGEMASLINVSNAHFQRLFKAEMLTTPACFIRQSRLDLVKLLLVQSDFHTIKEILFKVGLCDDRSFRKTWGVSPSSYRKLHWDDLQLQSNEE